MRDSTLATRDAMTNTGVRRAEVEASYNADVRALETKGSSNPRAMTARVQRLMVIQRAAVMPATQ